MSAAAVAELVKRAAVDLVVGDVVRRPGDAESFVLAGAQVAGPDSPWLFLKATNGRVFLTLWSTLWIVEPTEAAS